MMQHKYPRLYSFTKNKNPSVAQFLTNNTLKAQFYLPISVQALQEYQNLQEYIQTIQVHPDCKDSWQYIWGNNAYTSSRFYNLPYKNVQPPTPFTWIWNSKCCNKLVVFSWLLLMEGNNYNCVLCNSVTAMVKRRFSIFSSVVPSVKHVGNTLASIGILLRVSSK